MDVYVFDGSFDGLLTAVFEYYERKAQQVQLVSAASFQPSLLGAELTVYSDSTKAARVWAGLQKKWSGSWALRFYAAWLSEDQETFNHLFQLAVYLFGHAPGACNNFGNPHVLFIEQMYHKVHREKHRMEAFIRFQLTNDGIYYAIVQPDFNVLPLISKHFKDRYTDQQWIIYDEQRRYGLFYDLQTVSEISIDFVVDSSRITSALPVAVVAEDEELYRVLWKDYFKSTNIPERKNPKLHLRHVPGRYWRYLTEKWS